MYLIQIFFLYFYTFLISAFGAKTVGKVINIYDPKTIQASIEGSFTNACTPIETWDDFEFAL